jgi:hypothetical protein
MDTIENRASFTANEIRGEGERAAEGLVIREFVRAGYAVVGK